MKPIHAAGLLLLLSPACVHLGAPARAAPPWYPEREGGGRPLLAVFEGRIPCTAPERIGCDKVKVALALYEDPGSGSPVAYRLARTFVAEAPEGTRAVFAGSLTVARGTSLDAGATVYELDANAPAELRAFWAIGRDIVFILDDARRPRVGTASWSYCLNRVR